ncbi:MAG: Asp-tRNA(Asn)/Glu-tRNA(Gln) amidotransferase subunit GatC [bacterium]
MRLSPTEVKKVALLANLTLTPQEVDKFSAQLSDVLTYIDKLNELDTSGVEPISQVTGLVNVFRPDEVKKDRDIKSMAGKYFKTEAVF